MMKWMKGLMLMVLAAAALAAAACGGEDDSKIELTTADRAESESPAGLAYQPEIVVKEVEVIREVAVETAKVVEAEFLREVAVEKVVVEGETLAVRGPAGSAGGVDEQVASLAARQRIIVRTADMRLIVGDVADALDTISGMAGEFGGWTVSTNRSERHNGSISFRVPADRLGEAMGRLRDLADDVESEGTTSRDVTDEYVDNTSRLKNLQATEEALLRLLNRADDVEDALRVQRTLTETQAQIEVIQGRIKLLEETAAFSLVNVYLELAPGDISVDAGPDQTSSVGQPIRFRAMFEAPEGIEDYTLTWDFGDGSSLVTRGNTAPTDEEGIRVTATVTHVYSDERDSPFFAEVEIRGTGDAGLVEGSDSVTIIVTRLPTIEVFAGEGRIVDEGEEVEYSGSFTRPAELTEVTFGWDFGDGSSPVTGSLEDGATTAVASHVYADHRPFAYTATLTITGQSEAGEVEAKASVSVLVIESEGYVLGGFSVADAGKTAVRALSGVGQGIGIFFVWLGIFSPVWIAAVALWWFVRRRARRRSS